MKKTILSLSVLILISLPASADPILYTVTDLGLSTQAYGINAAGKVTGEYNGEHAGVYANGAWSDAGFGYPSTGRGINSSDK